MADSGAGDLIRDGLFRQLGYLDNLGVINLNELAGALGNDANFATSVATAIGNARTDWGYAANVAAGTTSVDVVHSLGSRDVMVQVSTVATPYAVVITDVELKDTNTVTLKFATAPSTNQYRALVRRVA